MAYLGQDNYGDTMTAEEQDALNSAFQSFSSGDIAGATAALGTSVVGVINPALLTNPYTALIAGAIAVALVLLKLVGRGRTEADMIVPIQNQLINPSGTGQLDQITQMLVRNPNVQGLQAMYESVERIAQAFNEFVSDARFTDGRASAQALNTMMPYINGTCGYQWPPPMRPTQGNCLTWGEGTPGGPGTDGMLGAIARAILRLGGQVPPPLPTQGYGTTIQQLTYQGSQNYPYIPQAGTLPANAPLSPLRPSSVPIISAGFGEGLLPAALIGGAAFLLLRKRR